MQLMPRQVPAQGGYNDQTSEFGDAYLILPNGQVFRMVSMQLASRTKVWASHGSLSPHVKNPDVTHLEFVRVEGLHGHLFNAARPGVDQHPPRCAAGIDLPVYVFYRALAQVGPPINNEWRRVPLVT